MAPWQSGSSLCAVAPYAGAWIEMPLKIDHSHLRAVAPYAGAWIEIGGDENAMYRAVASLPTRERGLKSVTVCALSSLGQVAPYAGAWIEIRKWIPLC